jgi:protein-tyrosine phosphatase
MAEGLLGSALVGRRPDVMVMSAGTQATPGQPMHRYAEAQLNRLSAGVPGFRTSALTDELIAEADLVLTASREHRAEVARRAPDAAARTFTLAELAWLLQGLPSPDRALSPSELAVTAAGRRGRVPPRPASDQDLADPYGRSRLSFSRCAEKICVLLAAPVAALTGPLLP